VNTFSLKRIPEVKGRIKFYYLLINGENQFEEFEKLIIREGNFLKELNTIQSIMTQVSELKQPLPEKKFKEITKDNSPFREYEIKSKHFRVYLFKEEFRGNIIVSGAKKSKKQQQDIAKFRKIKNDFIDWIKRNT
jgi:hypothetical protein